MALTGNKPSLVYNDITISKNSFWKAQAVPSSAASIFSAAMQEELKALIDDLMKPSPIFEFIRRERRPPCPFREVSE